MTQTKMRNWLVAGGIPSILLCAWLGVVSVERHALSPPPGVDSLAEFAARMPPPKRLAAIDDSGQTKIIWVGNDALWSLSSGPACYVFDASGRLVEWDTETGDAQRTDRYVGSAYEAKELTVEEALRLVEENRGALQ